MEVVLEVRQPLFFVGDTHQGSPECILSRFASGLGPRLTISKLLTMFYHSFAITIY
jgi:hypothetical protein